MCWKFEKSIWNSCNNLLFLLKVNPSYIIITIFLLFYTLSIRKRINFIILLFLFLLCFLLIGIIFRNIFFFVFFFTIFLFSAAGTKRSIFLWFFFTLNRNVLLHLYSIIFFLLSFIIIFRCYHIWSYFFFLRLFISFKLKRLSWLRKIWNKILFHLKLHWLLQLLFSVFTQRLCTWWITIILLIIRRLLIFTMAQFLHM